VATTSSFPSPVARRYGGALFELARAENCLDAVGQELDRFLSLIETHADLCRLVTSPLFAAKDQTAAMAGVIKKLGLPSKGAAGLVANFLKAVAANRRLPHLRAMVQVFAQLAAQARGEMVAAVTSAHALSSAQQRQLKKQLDEVSGKNVTLALTIDPSILGGLVVRLGSRQLDTSLKTKLSSLKMHLKEVG